MVGLAPSMATGGAPAAGTPAPAGGSPEPMPEGQPQEGRRATDEEKALYKEFLANTLNDIYEPETAEALGRVLRNTTQASPEAGSGSLVVGVETLALVVSGAVAKVAYHGLQNDLPITREMAAAAAATVSADIGRNMAEAAGVEPMSDEQIQALFLRSMELLGEERDRRKAERQQGGESPPETPATPPGNGLMAKHAAGMMPAEGGM